VGISPARWVRQVADDVPAFGWPTRSLRHWSLTTPVGGAELVEHPPTPHQSPPNIPGRKPWSRAGRRYRARSPSRFVRMRESAMEVISDLLIFLALVAVGLMVLNLLARRR
jgi:hypothetical protein